MNVCKKKETKIMYVMRSVACDACASDYSDIQSRNRNILFSVCELRIDKCFLSFHV